MTSATVQHPPTIRDLARELGVSKSTVAMALNNDPHLPASTRKRIQEAARKMGYRRNPTVSHLMATLRGSRTAGHKATLAFIHGKENRNDLESHRPSILLYQGARERALALGYGLDAFWLYNPEVPPDKLRAVLRARSIRGLIFNNSEQEDGRLPPAVSALIREYPCVFDCISENRPIFHYCGTDNFLLTWTSVQQAHERGYARCGLVLSERTHALSNGELLGGYLAGLATFYPDRIRQNAIELFLTLPAINAEEVFAEWYRRTRPDVILIHEEEIKLWLANLGKRVPQDTGLIHVDINRTMKGWAGMDHNHAEIGATTVDSLISLIHAGEHGPARYPVATMVEAIWRNGRTVRSKAPNI